MPRRHALTVVNLSAGGADNRMRRMSISLAALA
jgi:hypothetical protein